MSGMQHKKKKYREPQLLIDEIYESDDPAIRRAVHKFMDEKVSKARHRADLRLALRFKHLLPQVQQEKLEALVPDWRSMSLRKSTATITAIFSRMVNLECAIFQM